MRKKKIWFIAYSVLFILLFYPVTISAAEEQQTQANAMGTESTVSANDSGGKWVKDKRGVYIWRNPDGTYLKKKGWVILENHKYYLNEDGSRKKGLVTIGNQLYYLHPYVTYGMNTVNGKTYYFDNRTGAARKGWVELDGAKYYMKEDYSMARNEWVKDRYYFYIDKNGQLVTGPKWLKVSGSRYYIGKTGKRLTGLRTIDGKTYYFEKNGKLVVNKTAYRVGDKFYKIDSKGVMKETTGIKAQCSAATQAFIEEHTNKKMTNSQKFRACFNYIMAYTRFQPWKRPTTEEFECGIWPYKMALDMLNTNLSGCCYGVAGLVASCAKELGYQPYVIASTGEHAFVTIDGKYYDNMGPLFGATSHSAYKVAYKVKF